MIRSYVIRNLKLSQTLETIYQRLTPLYAIEFRTDAGLDFRDIFGNPNPVVMEIGCGKGEAVIELAQANLAVNYLAIEVFKAGVAALLKKIEALGLHNVRVIQHNAVEIVEHMIPDRTLQGVHIFFPDPWPKQRHHKRRLVREPFVSLLTQKLELNGYIHFVTDDLDYAKEAWVVFQNEPQLKNNSSGFIQERPSWRPITKYEAKAKSLDRPIWEVSFSKLCQTVLKQKSFLWSDHHVNS